MSHIFISYSRKDLDFAQKIVDALAANNLDTWIDWKSIPKGEDWEQEIYRGIEEADAFLFLISPDSVVSQMCNKEIAHAVKNNKRVLPIVVRDANVDGFIDETSKKEISKRNWIFCRDGQDDFNKTIEEARKTIHTDYEWLKYHTELQVKALKWEQKKDISRLLSGKELREAEERLARAGSLKDPQPTEIQRNYVLASQRNEIYQRRQITAGLSIGFVIVAALAVFAWVQRNTAVAEANSRATADANAIAEANARATALINEVSARATAQAESTRVANAQATSLANEGLATHGAQQASQQETLKISQELSNDAKSIITNDYRLGLLLGVESVRLNNLSQDNTLPQLLNKMTPGLIRTLDISSGAVRKIMYAQNGGLMVSMSDTIDLWNTEDPLSPERVESWKSSSISKPNDVVFSPNSKIMVIGYQDGHVELWDVSTVNIREINTPNDFSSQSLANIKVAISPNSQILAIAGNKRIKIWDISVPSSPQLICHIPKPHGVQVRVDVSYLSFAPGSTSPLLVSGGLDNYLSIWNLKYSFCPDRRDGPGRDYDPEIPNIALSSEYLLIADKEHIKIFSYSNNGLTPVGVPTKYTPYHSGIVSNMVISPDNSRLYTTAQDGIIVEWDFEDPQNMKFIKKFDGLMDHISSIAFHPDAKKKLLVVGGDENDSTITIWNLHQQNISTMWYDQILNDAEITDIAYSPKLNLLALGDDTGSIVLRNVSNPSNPTERRKTPIENERPIRHIAFNPSETALLFLGGFSNDAYRPAYRRDLTRLDVSENEYLFGTNTADVFVVGDKYILGGESVNGKTSIFQMDVAKANISRQIEMIGSVAQCPFKDTAFVRNGSLAAVAACKVQLWDFSDNNVPTMIKELEDSSDPRGVAFSTDGMLLASAHGNNSILIWGLASNSEYKLMHTIISAHTKGVTSVAISPDGKTMASGGGDQRVILWNISDPEHPTQIAELGLHTSPILNGGMFFLASAKTLISASNNEIILWDIDPQSWIEKACNLAGRNLTQSEWQRFVGPNIPYHNATCPELPIPPE